MSFDVPVRYLANSLDFHRMELLSISQRFYFLILVASGKRKNHVTN